MRRPQRSASVGEVPLPTVTSSRFAWTSTPWKLSKEPMNLRKKGRQLLTNFMTLAGLGTRTGGLPPQFPGLVAKAHCASSALAPTSASQTPSPLPIHPQTWATKASQWKKYLEMFKCPSHGNSRKNNFCSLWSQCKFPLPSLHWILTVKVASI